MKSEVKIVRPNDYQYSSPEDAEDAKRFRLGTVRRLTGAYKVRLSGSLKGAVPRKILDRDTINTEVLSYSAPKIFIEICKEVWGEHHKEAYTQIIIDHFYPKISSFTRKNGTETFPNVLLTTYLTMNKQEIKKRLQSFGNQRDLQLSSYLESMLQRSHMHHDRE